MSDVFIDISKEEFLKKYDEKTFNKFCREQTKFVFSKGNYFFNQLKIFSDIFGINILDYYVSLGDKTDISTTSYMDFSFKPEVDKIITLHTGSSYILNCLINYKRNKQLKLDYKLFEPLNLVEEGLIYLSAREIIAKCLETWMYSYEMEYKSFYSADNGNLRRYFLFLVKSGLLIL